MLRFVCSLVGWSASRVLLQGGRWEVGESGNQGSQDPTCVLAMSWQYLGNLRWLQGMQMMRPR